MLDPLLQSLFAAHPVEAEAERASAQFVAATMRRIQVAQQRRVRTTWIAAASAVLIIAGGSAGSSVETMHATATELGLLLATPTAWVCAIAVLFSAHALLRAQYTDG